MPAPDQPQPFSVVVEHAGGCNALCTEDRHYLIHAAADSAAVEPLGDGWVELGYVDEDGFR